MPPGRHHWAVIGFLLVTLVGTFPIAMELGSALMGLGDTLLNSWILAWEVHSLFGPGEASFFDTNIFYPYRNTLAYSEFLVPQLMIAAPVILSTGNPVLAHNVVLLFSLLTTALGAYLLAFRITASRSAGFAAGLILAFCPFMFSHLVHIQILFAGGIPLTFLFLFRWLERGRTRDAALLGLLYAIQALANAYYAVYLAFFAGLVLLGVVLRQRNWTRRRFWLQLLLAGIIASTLIGPFYWRYFQLKQEMGFQRVLPPPTPPRAFLGVPESNRLYGETLEAFAVPEAYLFPGFVASGLALIGLLQWARLARRDPSATDIKPPDEPSMRKRFQFLDGLIAAMATLVLLLSMGLAIDTHLGPIPLRIASWRNPAVLLTLLAAARIWAQRRWPGQARPLGLPSSGGAYPLILVSAGVLSLGTAPYLFLYRWIPGFSSLRAIPRIHVMFMFALAILAAQGMAFLLRQASETRRRALAAILPLLIVLEYFSAPLPVVAAPRPDQFPAVEQWLAKQDENLVYFAYPLRISDNILRLFHSTQHWRRMVNGFSGFIPPLYQELASKGRFFPSPSAVADLQDLGVDLLLIDTSRFREQRRLRLQASLGDMQALERVRVFDDTIVFRLEPRPAQLGPSSRLDSDLVALDHDRLTLDASVNVDSLDNALDRNRRTEWRSPMAPGEWLQVEWHEILAVAALELEISGSPHDYPRGFRLETSEDGHRWRTVAEKSDFHPPIRGFLQPNDFNLRFEWSPHRARMLRFIQTGDDTAHPWTVVELRVLARVP